MMNAPILQVSTLSWIWENCQYLVPVGWQSFWSWSGRPRISAPCYPFCPCSDVEPAQSSLQYTSSWRCASSWRCPREKTHTTHSTHTALMISNTRSSKDCSINVLPMWQYRHLILWVQVPHRIAVLKFSSSLSSTCRIGLLPYSHLFHLFLLCNNT